MSRCRVVPSTTCWQIPPRSASSRSYHSLLGCASAVKAGPCELRRTWYFGVPFLRFLQKGLSSFGISTCTSSVGTLLKEWSWPSRARRCGMYDVSSQERPYMFFQSKHGASNLSVFLKSGCPKNSIHPYCRNPTPPPPPPPATKGYNPNLEAPYGCLSRVSRH